MRRWQIDEKGMDEYLKTINRTPQQLRDDLRPVAEKKVQRTLALTEVARAEKIEISQADFEAEIATLTKDIAADRREKMIEILRMPQSQVNIASAIATRKTVLKLIDFTQSTSDTGPKTETAENKETETTENKELETKQKEAQT
jgi:trigger factor